MSEENRSDELVSNHQEISSPDFNDSLDLSEKNIAFENDQSPKSSDVTKTSIKGEFNPEGDIEPVAETKTSTDTEYDHDTETAGTESVEKPIIATEKIIQPADEPNFSLYSELFFGETKESVVERLTRTGKLTEDQAINMYDTLQNNFSGSGEHLVNKEYLKILEMIYEPEELYKNFLNGYKEIEIYPLASGTLNDNQLIEVNNKISKLVPSLADFIS